VTDDASSTAQAPQADVPEGDILAVVKNLPETMRRVLDYWRTKAKDREKKTVASTIMKAARSIKQEMRSAKGDKQGKKAKAAAAAAAAAAAQSTPEEVAAALYDILAENKEARVTGDPRQGEQTRINGTFDLNAIAREMMSPA
jgi:hypothetical protein